MSVRAARERAAELIESLGLAEVADRTVATLSGGQRRRLDIAMGLIHAPDLLFLDEPSTGLDPQNRANLQEHIMRLRAEHGTTIVLTTHYLDEADSMAERVIVVDHGGSSRTTRRSGSRPSTSATPSSSGSTPSTRRRGRPRCCGGASSSRTERK
jgi:ABC-type multidrug transport system ATPase subunit